MVCAAGKPLRGRSPGARLKRSEAWTQVNDRAKEKKSSWRGWGGHTIIVSNGFLIVLMPPPGAGGGSERLTGHDPSESEGTCPGRREAGEGAGVGTMVAQVLRVLMVCLL